MILAISGITGESYDNFFLSSDLEQAIIQNSNTEKPTAISYDVKSFDSVVAVYESLKKQQIYAKTSWIEVQNLIDTFNGLTKLFMIISILILITGIFISALLLIKLSSARYRDIGLLSAIGYIKFTITKILLYESLLLGIISSVTTLIMTFGVGVIFKFIFGYSDSISTSNLLISIFTAFAVIILMSLAINQKLLKTEPAEALRK